MAILRVGVEAFLNLREAGMIVDVRSPKEFAHAHIPGAVNIPLFSDDERADIGTLYTRVSREAAISRGFEYLNGRLEELRRSLLQTARHGAVRLHCWRGGMRSESVAWLVERSGVSVYLLEGGYKAYRSYVLERFASPMQLLVLAGMTGAGKTEVLTELAALGEQVIDLEALAHHKGSAFGGLGELPQPSTEQFENDLLAALRPLSSQKRLWLEDESRNIGRVLLPATFFSQMTAAPRVVLETPFSDRVARLTRIYTSHSPEELVSCIEKIRKRLGGDNANECIALIRHGDLRTAVERVLHYYDKRYGYGLQTASQILCRIVPSDAAPRAVAEQLLAALPHVPSCYGAGNL